jgi:uncharacterized membrane protein YhfC
MIISFTLNTVHAAADSVDIAYSFAYLFSGILEIIVPVLVAYYFIRKYNTSYRVLLIGAIMFVLSLVRIPLNQYVSMYIYYWNIGAYTFFMLAAFPSLTAGVFEESVRYIAYKYLIKEHTMANGLTLGAGHGGAESILVVGINVLTIGYLLLTNPGAFPPYQLLAIESSPVYLPFVGFYERLTALVVQISLSTMVLMSFRTGRNIYFASAILLHFLLDLFAILTINYGIVYPELIATGFALGLGFWAYDRVRSEESESEGLTTL